MIAIHPKNPQARVIREVVDLLKKDGVIIYPTDTVYGLGCAISSKQAVERIIAMKGRDPKKPLAMICHSLSQVSRYATLSNMAYPILRRFLPGPYTFVLPATRLVPKLLLPKQRTVGVRIPDHAVPLALVDALGEPLVGTSANLSGDDVLTTPDALKLTFGKHVDEILDCGDLAPTPSTVISLVDDRVVILRRGAGDLSYFDEWAEK